MSRGDDVNASIPLPVGFIVLLVVLAKAIKIVETFPAQRIQHEETL